VSIEELENEEAKAAKDAVEIDFLNHPDPLLRHQDRTGWTAEEITDACLNEDNYYQLLGLSSVLDLDEEEVLKRYKKAAITHHPDKKGKRLNEDHKKLWLKV
jgi:hypothetical protein